VFLAMRGVSRAFERGSKMRASGISGRLLDPREASAYLRIAKQPLARWRCYGLGPRFVRIGGRILYDPLDLDAFIAANKFQSTAEADQAA
jgi:hypothetical protein